METSEKNVWFSKFCNELEEKDFNISWSSSDSDGENLVGIPSQKRIHIHNKSNRNSRTWMSLINQQNRTPLKEGTQYSFQNQSLEISCTLTSPCLKDDFLDSPTLKSLKQDQSPPLIDNPITIYHEEKSPVISRRSILKKIKWRCRLKKKDMKLTQNIQDLPNSPDVLSFQPNILISDTQQTLDKPSPLRISPAKSEISPSWKIDPFPSQEGSEIPATDSCDTGSSLYHEPPPRKKRLKKGGLAHQLQKALDAQRTSLAIWQHELYLSRTKDVEVPLAGKSGDNIEYSFNLINKWKEYSCTILECKFIDEVDSASLSTGCSHFQIENNTFLVIIGMNISVNVSFELGKCYKIFPPYATKMVKHQLKQTICFINASRFISVN